MGLKPNPDFLLSYLFEHELGLWLLLHLAGLLLFPLSIQHPEDYFALSQAEASSPSPIFIPALCALSACVTTPSSRQIINLEHPPIFFFSIWGFEAWRLGLVCSPKQREGVRVEVHPHMALKHTLPRAATSDNVCLVYARAGSFCAVDGARRP